eukprot:CAMPEP_0194058534 /NCGR_PEP_ID=MMETSP0009_2-20130614/66531_1 /TAXON_ID=210454 /ORGANISM="Grammatophora oceanica, Strain CCMP 410" /LENGTH=97 /DNA_ID=CAMNT_0038708721 /DNA_START=48 /DNA_END=338 /DNA_ORIENTATION=+
MDMPQSNAEMMDVFNTPEPEVIFVLGPDIGRDRKYVLKTVSTSFGLAGMWYLSVYPFLFNSQLAERIDEQVQYANSGMPTDMSFLTDLSVPLFVTFL